MKIYLCGPMTGLPQNNFPAFDAAAARLRAEPQFEVVSPAELDDEVDRALALADAPATKTWGDFLARDVKLIADSGIDAIAVLPNWTKSRGARLEAMVGLLCGLMFFEYNHPSGLIPIGRARIALGLAGSFA